MADDLYITIDGVYRKVLRGLITMGGVYRQWYEAVRGNPTFYGEVTPLSSAVSNAGQSKVPSTANHLFRCGGYLSNGKAADVVDVYDRTLTKTSATLATPTRDSGFASFGRYALCAGGFHDQAGSYVANVNAFEDDGTRLDAPNLATARSTLCGAANDEYAVFAGGGNGSVVEAYSGELTRNTATALTTTSNYVGGAGNADKAWFFGGMVGSSYRNLAVSYDQNLTRTILSNLSVPRYGIGAEVIGGYAIAAGGCTRSGFAGFKNTVDAYDVNNNTKTTLTSLTTANSVGVANLDGYCIITGAGMANYFDEDLVLHDLGVTAMHGQVFVGTVGSYYLSMGGFPTTSWDSMHNTVNAITV